MKRALKIVHYAVLLVKIGGLEALLAQLRRQFYSTVILFGFEKNLNAKGVRISSSVPYSWQKAMERDMEELLEKTKMESKGSVHELIKRKWFYEAGFRDCYAARAADTGELCFVAWLISKNDDNLINRSFKSRLPSLREDELLLENCYTFEKYRGNNILPSVVSELSKLAKGMGYRRMIAYIKQDNEASLRAFKKLGFRKFEEIPEFKLFFFTSREHKFAFNSLGLF